MSCGCWNAPVTAPRQPWTPERRASTPGRPLAGRRSVVLASEPMDADAEWRLLDPGELLHVAGDLDVDTETVLPDPPTQRLRLRDLSADAATSQQALP